MDKLLHHLGCPKLLIYTAKTVFLGIVCGAGFFPANNGTRLWTLPSHCWEQLFLKTTPICLQGVQSSSAVFGFISLGCCKVPFMQDLVIAQWGFEQCKACLQWLLPCIGHCILCFQDVELRQSLQKRKLACSKKNQDHFLWCEHVGPHQAAWHTIISLTCFAGALCKKLVALDACLLSWGEDWEHRSWYFQIKSRNPNSLNVEKDFFPLDQQPWIKTSGWSLNQNIMMIKESQFQVGPRVARCLPPPTITCIPN